MTKFSKKALTVAPSATMQMTALAKKMQHEGQNVINLSVGQPDFITPKEIQKAAITSIETGQASFYTAVDGLLELKNAISKRVFEDTHFSLASDNITTTTGAKMALYVLFQALLEEQDEVLLLAPYWVSYEEQIKLSGAKAIVVKPSASDFKVTIAELEAKRTIKTRMLIINSPQNPNGTVYTATELSNILKWARKNDIILVADEIYKNLVFNGTKMTSILNNVDNLKNLVVIDGVSKTYAMTGWRLGYLIADTEIIQHVRALLGHMTSNPATVTQYAAIAALSEKQTSVAEMRRVFEKRLNLVFDRLAKIPEVEISERPSGAFYLFPKVTKLMKLVGVTTSNELAVKLLKEAFVATVPGEAFGLPGYIRLSYAASENDLETALARIETFIEHYR